MINREIPRWLSSKESTYRWCRRRWFNPWVGKIPWRRAWQPTPVFVPGESQGLNTLASYSPQGHKESDTTEATDDAHIINRWLCRLHINNPWKHFSLHKPLGSLYRIPQKLQHSTLSDCMLLMSLDFNKWYHTPTRDSAECQRWQQWEASCTTGPGWGAMLPEPYPVGAMVLGRGTLPLATRALGEREPRN